MKQSTFRFLSSLMLAGALLSVQAPNLVMAQDTTAATASSEEMTWAPTLAPTMLDDSAPLISIDGNDFTVAAVKMLMDLRPMQKDGLMWEWETGGLRGDDLIYVGAHIHAWDILAKEARAKGAELTDEDQDMVDQRLLRYESSIIYKQEILGKIAEVTEDEVRAIYDESREEKFAIQEQMDMAHIIISTYVPYTVEEGDTLESIAEKIGGDVSVAELILSDETKLPRVESLKVADEADEENVIPEGEELPARGLVVGEVLLVPSTGEIEETAKTKIDEAYARLEAGESFTEVAKEFSEAGSPGNIMRIRPATLQREMMPLVREIFMGLEDKSYSEPFRTKHGYQILYRDRYIEEGFRDFDSVKAGIEKDLQAERSQKQVGSYFAGIIEDSGLVTINDEVLAEETPAADAVVLKIEDTEYTYGKLNELTRNSLGNPTNRTAEGFRSLLWKVNPLQIALLDAWKSANDFENRPEVKSMRTMAENSLIATRYINEMVTETGVNVLEEEVEELYESLKQKNYRTPESFNLNQIVMKVTGEGDMAAEVTAKELKEKLKTIQSLEQFEQIASTINPANDQRFKNGSAVGTVLASRLQPNELEAIKATEIPGMTDVVIFEDEAIVYWVSNHTEESFVPLDDVRESLTDRIRIDKESDMRYDILKSILPEAKSAVKIINDEAKEMPSDD